MPLYNPSVLTDTTFPTTATRANATVTNTAENLLTATGKGFTVRNISSVTVYLGYGATAPTSTNYTVDLAPGAYFEDPYRYSGVVQAIAASGTTNAVLTTVFS
jgi:hypothetical protein